MRGRACLRLLDDGGHDTRAHRPPTLPDREPKPILHRDRLDQLNGKLHVITRHHHLHPIRQRHHPRHIRRPEVELRPVPREERRMPTPLLLLQDVNTPHETRMRRDRTRLSQHLPPLDILTPHTPKQHPHVIASLTPIQRLTVHLHPRNHRLGRILKAHDLNLIPRLHHTQRGENEWVDRIWELLDAVDNYIPTPERDIDKAFLMPVEDVFTITGRGTVATGRIERGVVKTGDEVEIVGLKDTAKSVVTGVEMHRKTLDSGEAGDNVGVLLRGVGRDDIERGQVLAKPGSITPHTVFNGSVYILKKEEGGRHSAFFTGYRPQFYFRTTDVTGVVTLPDGVEMVMPGDNVELSVELIKPIAMEDGLRFAIREGGRTVGAGVVTAVTK